MLTRWLLTVVVTLALPVGGQAQTREAKVLEDRKRVEAEGYWIYNDLPRGIVEAKQAGKPILVVLRCIPCEECVKLDDELIDQHPQVKPLLEKFVRVRIVGTNGLDLSLFQFDYDQSFAAFLLNADGTIYGRFGTRSHRTSWAGDVSVAGLARALEGALELHRDHHKYKDALAGKRGPKPLFTSPEQFPSLRDKYGPKLTYEKNVVQSCIHCHQIGDAIRTHHRSQPDGFPEEVLYSYPHPRSLGLVLDPAERATVLKVEADSHAAQAGFHPGDTIESLEGQPLLSIADVQWVLHIASPQGAKLAAIVSRKGRKQTLTLELPPRWRKQDIAWRASTWGLRRMATGGLVLEAATAEEKRKAGVERSQPALRVKHVGQYGPHAAAKAAGFQVDDLVLRLGGLPISTETAFIAQALFDFRPGETMKILVHRDGKQFELILPAQP